MVAVDGQVAAGVATSLLTKGAVALLGSGKELLGVGQVGVGSVAAGAEDVASAASSSLGPVGDTVSAGLSSVVSQVSNAASAVSSALDLDCTAGAGAGLWVSAVRLSCVRLREGWGLRGCYGVRSSTPTLCCVVLLSPSRPPGAVVGSLVEGLNSLASSLPIVGTAAAALVVLFNVYKQVQFNKVGGGTREMTCSRGGP